MISVGRTARPQAVPARDAFSERSMGYENLHVAYEGGIAVVTVSRPKKLNALSARTLEDHTPRFQGR